MKPWLFISDLHLSPERPEIIELFLRFTTDVAAGAGRLYILGDLLEYWIGDDDPADGLAPAFDALANLHKAGTETWFMPGNRDFLVGETLAARCGFQILDEPAILDYQGNKLMLMHGDSLCVDDVDYQAFRSMVRDPAWQQDFLSKPLAERDAIARSVRTQSKQQSSLKDEVIMDVNQHSVETAMREHDTRLLIHGHTHRPAVHHFELDGGNATRIVLTDWYDSGGYLRLDGSDEYQLTSYA